MAFSCSVVGNPPPSVSWTKNGVELNFTANHRVSLFSTNNNHSLAITDVQHSDTGQYRCVASNTVGRSTSFSATLTVPCEYFGQLCKCETLQLSLVNTSLRYLGPVLWNKLNKEVRMSKSIIEFKNRIRTQD